MVWEAGWDGNSFSVLLVREITGLDMLFLMELWSGEMGMVEEGEQGPEPLLHVLDEEVLDAERPKTDDKVEDEGSVPGPQEPQEDAEGEVHAVEVGVLGPGSLERSNTHEAAHPGREATPPRRSQDRHPPGRDGLRFCCDEERA